MRNGERAKLEAEYVINTMSLLLQEILKHVRLTDYFSCLDTITITEELVQDSDIFFKLMLFATNNQAFTSPCQFETKAPA